ncbi:MAG: hypothetical protein WDN24_18190 [Sphingomonas sp.]
MLKTTGTYAIYDPDYLSTVQAAILDVISDLTGMCGPALSLKIHPKLRQRRSNSGTKKPRQPSRLTGFSNGGRGKD